MPIVAQRIIDDLRSIGLDAAVDTDYYNDVEDLIPAINSAVRWLVSLIDATRNKDKRVDEVLKELSRSRVYQLDDKSRFEMEGKVWTIDAIMPLPSTATITGVTPIVQSDAEVSIERPDLVHLYSNYHASRLTIEEWAVNRKNPFAAGNTVCPCAEDLTNGSDKNVTFAYLNPYEYVDTSASYLLEIRPFIPNKLATIFYIVNPTEIVAASDELQFSENLFTLIYDKSLQFVSYNQGDNTNIWSVTEQDIQKLIASIK